MSHVASVMLITSGIEHNYREGGWLVDKLNHYLVEKHDRSLKQVDQYAGGDKGFQARVYMAGINYLDIPEFVDLFCSIPWELPFMATLLIRDEHDDTFTVYRPNDVADCLSKGAS
jgi:hypothetical protein